DAVRDALRDPTRLGIEGLHRSGRGWMAPCPLHPDGTPSFSIIDYPDGLGWTCFAQCGGGDVLSLVGRMHGLDTGGGAFRRLVELGEQIASIGINASITTALRHPAPQPEPPREPPPEVEVLMTWDAAVRVCDDAEACAWLIQNRSLEPDRIEERNLARVL